MLTSESPLHPSAGPFGSPFVRSMAFILNKGKVILFTEVHFMPSLNKIIPIALFIYNVHYVYQYYQYFYYLHYRILEDFGKLGMLAFWRIKNSPK